MEKIYKIDQVKMTGSIGGQSNNYCYVETIPEYFNHHEFDRLPTSEFEYCLANSNIENGILGGQFELVEYMGSHTILMVGSPKYNKAIKTLQKKEKQKA